MKKETVLPPNTLYLQWFGDSDDVNDPIPKDGEIRGTWCREKIFNHDLEYVRADLVRQELQGHKCSELFGESGLIAATMRSINNCETLHEKHILRIELVNRSTTEAEHSTRERDLRNWRAGVEDAGSKLDLCAADWYYLDQGIDRPMCYGVWLDWSEANAIGEASPPELQ